MFVSKTEHKRDSKPQSGCFCKTCLRKREARRRAKRIVRRRVDRQLRWWFRAFFPGASRPPARRSRRRR